MANVSANPVKSRRVNKLQFGPFFASIKATF